MAMLHDRPVAAGSSWCQQSFLSPRRVPWLCRWAGRGNIGPLASSLAVVVVVDIDEAAQQSVTPPNGIVHIVLKTPCNGSVVVVLWCLSRSKDNAMNHFVAVLWRGGKPTYDVTVTTHLLSS